MQWLRSLLSWIAYGIAFQLFVVGVLGGAAGATSSYIAVYAASYIIGFLALFAPGGVVVRESALVAGMVRLGLASQADAFAVAVASRLWLTVVELLPGFIALASRAALLQRSTDAMKRNAGSARKTASGKATDTADIEEAVPYPRQV